MQKYVTNPGPNTMYVGNTMIPPGEGKVVEVHERAAAVVVAAPAGPNIVELIEQLLGKPVTEIVLELPVLTNEALDVAESQESAGKNRKTLTAAIQAERIARADAKLQAQQDQAKVDAVHAARNELMSAKLAIANLHEDSADRAAAQARVAEAQAKVDALTPAAA